MSAGGGAGSGWTLVTGGKSGARVWRGSGVHRKQDARERIAAEAARLVWLGEQGIPCPEVVHVDGDVLVTTTVPGAPATQHSADCWDRLLDGFAEVLTALHELPVASCPFDESLAVTVPRAERAAHECRVDLDDLDAEHRGWSARQLLDRLHATRPTSEDLVVCHGDPGVRNVLFTGDGALAGVVDVGSLGVADRCRDLAVASRSLRDHLAPDCAEGLLRRCAAVTADDPRLAFYRLLDEFA